MHRHAGTSNGDVTDGGSRIRRGHARTYLHMNRHAYSLRHSQNASEYLFTRDRANMRSFVRSLARPSVGIARDAHGVFNAVGLLLITRSVVESFCELLEVMLYQD